MPSESSTISERSSLISKLTSRFNNRTRVISDFYIEPEDPWRTYYAGDVVKGTVVLAVVKPLRVTHLTVCLHGFAKVYRNTVIASETPPAGEHGLAGEVRSRKGCEYMGNGYASLFEDEISLCGEGRLKEGQYRFMFELEFPSQSLPSSINFERGTISYMITSTLTRPTTISPLFTCDKRLIFAEAIDIGPLAMPKPRFISLEPVSRKQKSKTKIKATPDHLVKVSSASQQAEATDPSLTPTRQPPQSPAPSDLSHASTVSSSVQSYLNTPAAGSPLRDNDGGPSSPISPLSVKTRSITAMIELLKGGGLPGDLLPLRIVVNHVKPLRSTNGIIITLYRQGRVDWKPSMDGSSNSKGKKSAREDAYPKSRTGLGVLSFGGARTNSLFRKDLSQTFAPLVVDPSTLKAAVNTSIRIPEDVFPTIKNVPGGMISFRYYVEVVMDFRGRLDRYLPTPATSTTGPASYSYSPAAQSFDIDQGKNVTSTFGGSILDTDQVRREKSVVSCSFEVVIGTKDTSRKYDKLKRQPQRLSEENFRTDMSALSQYRSHSSYPETDRESTLSDEPVPELREHDSHIEQTHRHYHTVDESTTYGKSGPSEAPSNSPHQHIPETQVSLAPPTEPDEILDEKARLRQAEETLLPSRPPEDPTSRRRGDFAPTSPMVTREDDGGDDPPSFYQSSQGQLQFPFLNEDDAGIDYRYIHGAGPSINLPLRQRETSAPPTAFLTTSPIFHAPPPFTSHHSARESYFSSQQIRVSNCYPESPSEGLRTRFVSGSQLGNGQSTSEHHPQTEDKQELERQRLLAAASVPEPTFYNQYGDSRAASSDALAGTRSNTNMAVPPNVLTEEDLLHQTPATDALPRYRL